jgi:CubicO group peptidase (beta-lactamase class C family)
MKKLIIYILFVTFFTTGNIIADEQITFNITGPDAKSLGSERNYPACDITDHRQKKECRVGNFSNVANTGFYHIRKISPSSNPMLFGYYNPSKNLIRSADKLLSNHPIMSLMIIRNGQIVLEKYQYNRKRENVFRSFSVAKTFTAMLVGIAIQKGHISSIEDKVSKYWPEISKSVYGDVSIKNLLRMSSAVYDSDNSINDSDTPTVNFYAMLNQKENFNQPKRLEDYINGIQKSEKLKVTNVTQGNRPIYTSVDTEILTRVLIKATKKNLTDLTSEWLWKPMGARGNGSWLYSTTDLIENGGSGFNASLTDYGRFGVLLANDGKRDGVQIIPKEFLLDATSKERVEKNYINIGNDWTYGYGYQTWILPNKERTFCLLGHYGQFLCVQPETKIVFVQFSAGGHTNENRNLSRDTYDFFQQALIELKN